MEADVNLVLLISNSSRSNIVNLVIELWRLIMSRFVWRECVSPKIGYVYSK